MARKLTKDEQFDADEAAGIAALKRIERQEAVKRVMREYAVDKFTAEEIVENAIRSGKPA